MLRRFKNTGHVMVSKIFPAGMGWQLGSVLAAGSDPFTFALATGFGDALGVGAGHLTYEAVFRGKKVSTERSTALLLSTAAFGSGSIWQPTVDTALSFGTVECVPVMFGTGVVCGTVFLGGLRLGRRIYDVPAVPLVQDVQLATSIGGATGTFVATDPSLAGNVAADVLGITDTDAILTAGIKAGASTASGFAAVQSVQNATVSRAWTDAD